MKRRETGRLQTECYCDGWVTDFHSEQNRTEQTTQRIPSCPSLNHCTLGVAAAGSGTEGQGQVRMEGFDMVALALEIGEVGTTAGKKRRQKTLKREEKRPNMTSVSSHNLVGGLSLGNSNQTKELLGWEEVIYSARCRSSQSRDDITHHKEKARLMNYLILYRLHRSHVTRWSSKRIGSKTRYWARGGSKNNFLDRCKHIFYS